ncbi:biotin synthase [Acididesulfobacillus acetoxydans]|uniref:biotin synthase n=2 Tax=Acididesulfobacillus acetoxydans TaxID=1561005 RepID=A0A8S0XAJ5_9FIRM|nr:biotin synthase [Acididesulfobacillus acetoxydans]CEJ07962.1 Radical SAM domain protein [Acididesulfobacillus acetoxydans]
MSAGYRSKVVKGEGRSFMPVEGTFKELLNQGLTGINPEVAAELLELSAEPGNALELFRAAGKMRDEHLGMTLWWSAGISRIFPCRVAPRCGYCSYFTDEFMPTEQIVSSIQALESSGFRQVHLSGGTDLRGYDREMLELVQAIRRVSAIDLEINLGPSFRRETIRALKALGVTSVTSSLEVCNDSLFHEAKPGDSLSARRRLMEVCEEEGMSVRSMILIGLGESYADRISHLFYLKQFRHLYHVRFSRFYPYPGTKFSGFPRCSPWELARTLAVARLILPGVELGLAAGNDHDDIPLWFLAGGGNQLLGAGITRDPAPKLPGARIQPIGQDLYLVDKTPLLRQYVGGMGRETTFECPAK